MSLIQRQTLGHSLLKRFCLYALGPNLLLSMFSGSQVFGSTLDLWPLSALLHCYAIMSQPSLLHHSFLFSRLMLRGHESDDCVVEEASRVTDRVTEIRKEERDVLV